MQRCPLGTVFLLVEPFKEIGHLCHGNAHRRIQCAKRVIALFSDQCLMCHVKGHNNNRYAGFKHNISSLWIDVDVEFSRGCDVAPLEIAATHQDNLGHARHNVRGFLKGGSDIGQRSQGAQRDPARIMCSKLFDDEINPVPVA